MEDNELKRLNRNKAISLSGIMLSTLGLLALVSFNYTLWWSTLVPLLINLSLFLYNLRKIKNLKEKCKNSEIPILTDIYCPGYC